MTSTPDGLRYSSDHLWVRVANDRRRLVVGLTDFAQDSLGDIVAVDGPSVSDAVEAGQACGEVESTKSVSDLIAPVSGTVISVNDALGENPERINTDPYGQGWLFEIAVADGNADEAARSLLSPEQYLRVSSGA